MQILMIVALIAVFYFMMIRPQQKRQKEIRNFRQGIQNGDRVVTAGGIYATVRKVCKTTFKLEVANGVVIEIDQNSVYPAPPTAMDDTQVTKD